MVNPGQELSSINFRDMIGGPLRAVVEAQAAAALSTVNFIKEVGFERAPGSDGTVQETGRPVYVTFRYPKEVAPYQPSVPEQPSSFSIQVADGGLGYAANSTNIPVSLTPPGGSGTAATATATTDGTGKIVSVTLSPGAGYTSPPIATVDPTPTGTGAKAASLKVTGFVPFQERRDAQAAQFQDMRMEVPLLTIVPIPYLRVEETTIQFNAKITSMTYEKASSDLRVDANLSASAGWGWGRASLNVSAAYQKKTESGEEVNRTYSLDILVRAVQDELPGGMERVLGILEDAIRSQPSGGVEPVALAA